MRTVLVGAVLGFLAVPAVAKNYDPWSHASWKQFADQGGIQGFISAATGTYNDGWKATFVRWEYGPQGLNVGPRSPSARSGVIKMEFDCATGRSQADILVLYQGTNLAGGFLQSATGSAADMLSKLPGVVPVELKPKLVDAVCNGLPGR